MILNSPAQNYVVISQNKEIGEKTSIFFSFLAFLCGSISWHKLNLVGELYSTEIAVIICAVIVFISKKQHLQIDTDLFKKYLIFGLLLLVGYIVSDLINQTPENMYMRGWGRVLLLLTDLVAITIIFGAQKNTVIWFFLGMAIGNISVLLASGKLNLDTFKFYWAIPLILIICSLLPKFSIKLTSLVLILVGLAYIRYDFRSAGAIAVVLGGLLFLGSRRDLKKVKLLPILIIGFLAAFAIKTTLEITTDKLETRRATSSVGRFAALSVGLQAIIDSPLIGTGSWGNNTEKYAKALYEETKDEMRQLGQRYHREGDSFVAHSQIIQSWMEGGLLAAAFFIFYGYRILKSAQFVLLKTSVNQYTAIYGFNLILGFWHLFMSPFGGDHRVNIASCIAITISVMYFNNLSKNNSQLKNES